MKKLFFPPSKFQTVPLPAPQTHSQPRAKTTPLSNIFLFYFIDFVYREVELGKTNPFQFSSPSICLYYYCKMNPFLELQPYYLFVILLQNESFFSIATLLSVCTTTAK